MGFRVCGLGLYFMNLLATERNMSDRRIKGWAADAEKKEFTMRYLIIIGLAVSAALLSSGCSDPSALGRFRATPMTNVILDNLGVVDEDPAVFAGAREPRPDDLIADPREYVIGPGDFLDISIFELFSTNMEWTARKPVSDTGRITLPIIGTLQGAGRTELELTDDIIGRLSPSVLRDPKVSVVVVAARERVYSISGAVQAPGTYELQPGEFRLSQALAQAGGIPQFNADYAYVIRTVSSEELARRMEQEMAARGEVEKPWWEGENLPAPPLAPGIGEAAPPEPVQEFTPIVKPPVMEGEAPEIVMPFEKPQNEIKKDESVEPAPAEKVDERKELLESVAPMSVVKVDPPLVRWESDKVVTAVTRFESGSVVEESDKEMVLLNAGAERPMKLVRRGTRFELVPSGGGEAYEPRPTEPEKSWMEPAGDTSAKSTGDALAAAGLTQEVVRVNLKELRGGDLKQNMIIRPGDDIQVPYNTVGEFYVMGQVARPGPYSLTGRKLTLKHALAAAGPMTALAWPSRCDVIRRIGENQEVVYRVNLQKIMEGNAPDIFLKADDIINVGSHPVARWIGVVRQSFRFTYGFGFVYDRNFADKDIGH